MPNYKMTRTTTILTLTFLALLTACDNPKRQTEKDTVTQFDTTNAIKIGDSWATPKPTFEFNSLLDSSADTLKLVTCAEFVYSPFGQLNNKSDLPTSNLKNFKILDRLDKMDIGEIEFQILTLNKSRLILFFDNDPEASKHSYIFKGEIKDSNVNFIEGIKIGMTKEDFIKTFFDNFPSELMTKYNFLVFESCVQDIKHTYSFKDNKLQSINFITDSYWTVNY
ncbi:hypothetical protein KLP40_20525 [Hymenobacter sp. NST-14]|uniref:hypothetical protein n=1 Tax=Hymenobacter piscis TaxID=2839984 RepID=UPI001C01DF9A|nr:hypothetical protein [Hymenobacter piscis]MBT9395563.1 hypothetical protein [Hymenobacter piscis]